MAGEDKGAGAEQDGGKVVARSIAKSPPSWLERGLDDRRFAPAPRERPVNALASAEPRPTTIIIVPPGGAIVEAGHGVKPEHALKQVRAKLSRKAITSRMPMGPKRAPERRNGSRPPGCRPAALRSGRLRATGSRSEQRQERQAGRNEKGSIAPRCPAGRQSQGRGPCRRHRRDDAHAAPLASFVESLM